MVASPPRVAGGDRWKWPVGVTLLLVCGAAFFLRTFYLHELVFPADGSVSLQDNDPWYHYRVLQWQVHHLPQRFLHDPYAIFPDGQGAPVGPFFDLSLASILCAVSFGAPSQALIDWAAAYYAPILAIIVCIVTFAGGRVIFNRWVGLIAAAAIGLLPGSYFVRSSLGFFDHHIMEVLLSTAVLWLLASALTPSEPAEGANSRRRRADLRSLLAGVMLACYLLTWVGGNFLLVVLLAWGLLQHGWDYIAGRTSSSCSRALVICFAAALSILLAYFDYGWQRMQIQGLLGGIVMVAALAGLAIFCRRRGMGARSYLGILAGAAVLVVMLVQVLEPSMLARVRAEFGRLAPDAASRTITEARPIIWTNRGLSLTPLWEMFGTTLPAAVVGLTILLVGMVRRPAPARTLLAVWSIIVLMAMFGQGRFSYYAGPVIALLMGYACHAVVSATWNMGRNRKPSDKASPQPQTMRAATCGALCAATLAVCFVPSMLRLPTVIRYHDGPTADWIEAMCWLRDNSPEPFGSPDAYYAACRDREEMSKQLDSSGAYGVMSWWDYGYWISGIARRVPNSNPTQAGATDCARFMLAQTDEEAEALLKQHGSRYIVLDWMIPRWEKPGESKVRGKFTAITVWAGQDISRFYERVTMTNEKGERVSRFLYYPAYFRSMAVRLFVYSAGQIGTARPVRVYTLADQREASGATRKVVTAVREFDTHEAASAFVDAANDPATRIASESPFLSCVPIPAPARIRLIHQSPKIVASIHGRKVAPVRIFEYMASWP